MRLDPLREVAGLGHLLRRPRHAAHRCERGARNDETERGRERDAAEADPDEDLPDLAQRVVDAGEVLRDLERRRLSVRVLNGNGHDAEVATGDTRVAHELVRLLALGNGECFLRHRNRRRAEFLECDERRAARPDELHESAAADDPAMDVEVVLSVCARLEMKRWPRRELERLRAHGIVDLAAHLMADDDVDDRRGEDDRERDGGGGDKCQPRPEAHAVRRA